ncbi:hypothetical protein GPECTOR_12g580 [Gonium pectorale]|uniref:Uncharacterized protein n=1 Tax=Gonium pectorale TaxID=33097 RepID=A0A150GP29_GONPE|nr:hypothetical protein GPECTOR_12g580 [Gonium pectorale]|eukprot:KXZ51616.1 hypothetical protein GPECTOR_12g580 [Gonium pectorale]
MGAPPAADGSDRHLAANHLGPYLLTRLLLPHMTHGSRVVNVASRAHYAGSLTLRTGGPPGSEGVEDNVRHWWWQYARSKLCNVLFTAELQRRYGGGAANAAGGAAPPQQPRTAAIRAFAVSPGLVDSGIFRSRLIGDHKPTLGASHQHRFPPLR